jgi:hypothetical protein
MVLLQGNGNLRLSLWFYCEEGDNSNVVNFLYGGGFLFFLVAAYGLVH